MQVSVVQFRPWAPTHKFDLILLGFFSQSPTLRKWNRIPSLPPCGDATFVCCALVSDGVSAAGLFRVSAIAPLLACASLLLFARLWSQGGEHAVSSEALPDGDRERVAMS
jgi:hypothetical protein